MTTIDKPKKISPKLNRQIPSLDSFEETYKTAYTHGLEVIYSLENVDLKTIRKIEEHRSENSFLQEISENADKSLYSVEAQLEFDLGHDFRNWIEPFFLNEPIRMLGLSSQAEGCLLEHGLKTISDLSTHDFKDYVFMKGMGQGHIDEVKKKLEKYIGGRSFKKTYSIDFKSILMAASAGINLKKVAHFLKKFDLADEIPLTIAEKIEVRAFDNSKDPSWYQEVLAHFREPVRQKQFVQVLGKISRVFLVPWIRNRGGVANEEEIVERLERICEKPLTLPYYLKFMKEIFFNGKFPFASNFLQPEPNVYCCSKECNAHYREIVDATLSYFYKPGVTYLLQELLQLLLREFGTQWRNYSQEFIRGCLMYTQMVKIFRVSSGELRITLA